MELRKDLNQKVSFQEMDYSEIKTSLLEFSKYKNLAKKTIAVLVQMPTTYLCEEGFFSQVEIKSKKRNSILDIDSLMRGGVEKELPHIMFKLRKLCKNKQATKSIWSLLRV